MRIDIIAIFFFLLAITTYEAHGKYYPYYGPPMFGGSGSGSDEYVMSVPPPLPPPTQEDKDNGAKIVDSKFDEKTIATILPFQNLEHRKVINEYMDTLKNGRRIVENKYLPTHEKNPPFKDLCFALLNDPIKVLAMYLGEFLHRKDETFIIIVLTLCPKMKDLQYIYDQNHKNSLTKRRRKQRHPFANLMKAWIGFADRQTEDGCNFTPDEVNKDLGHLKEEYPHWKKTRDTIEYVLMLKCPKFATEVLKRFEDDMKITVEKAIQDKIDNHDLVDAYLSLVLFVRDRPQYIAKTLLNYSNGSDRWAVWIMLVGFVASEDWPQIDQAFRPISGNVGLVDFITSNQEPDKILLGVMAVMIDPKYKPTYL